MRRRALLSVAAGGLAGVTGCLGYSVDTSGEAESDESTADEATSSSTEDPTTAEPTQTAEVTVSDVELHYGVVVPNSPDSIGIAHEDTQYLATSVRVDGALAPDEFALVVGDDRVVPTRIERLYRTSWGDDQWYERETGVGVLLFEIPASAGGDLALSWPGGEHALDRSLASRLGGNPPRFSASLSLPETHVVQEIPQPPVEVRVTNESTVPRRFVGALNRTGPTIAYTPVARVCELVSAGETTTLTVPDRWSAHRPAEERIGDDHPDVTYHLHYVGGEDSAGIRFTDRN